MRIALMISALGRGGAEGQLIRLAHGLQKRGHSVEVWCYGGSSKLDDELRGNGIVVRNSLKRSVLAKVVSVRTWHRDFHPDVVHGFMKRASTLAVLAGLGQREARIIGSDLSTATYGRRKPSLWVSLVFFRFADAVATQTELNRRSLEKLAPWLRGRTRVIRNGLDMERFRPGPVTGANGPFRFCAVGSVYGVKNPWGLVQAAIELRRRGLEDFRIDWYGRLGLKGDGQPSAAYLEAMREARANGVADVVTFHGETPNVVDVYRSADALVHPSVQEGFPNAVVEGMACGLPIVVSRVSDLPLVVNEARNGFVFDETDPSAIADAMQKMMGLSPDARAAMGERSREIAVRWFGLGRFVDEYEQLYRELVARRQS
jgi:glycosyltransferase involved in cell wall biosynthesis